MPKGKEVTPYEKRLINLWVEKVLSYNPSTYPEFIRIMKPDPQKGELFAFELSTRNANNDLASPECYCEFRFYRKNQCSIWLIAHNPEDPGKNIYRKYENLLKQYKTQNTFYTTWYKGVGIIARLLLALQEDTELPLPIL